MCQYFPIHLCHAEAEHKTEMEKLRCLQTTLLGCLFGTCRVNIYFFFKLSKIIYLCINFSHQNYHIRLKIIIRHTNIDKNSHKFYEFETFIILNANLDLELWGSIHVLSFKNEVNIRKH